MTDLTNWPDLVHVAMVRSSDGRTGKYHEPPTFGARERTEVLWINPQVSAAIDAAQAQIRLL